MEIWQKDNGLVPEDEWTSRIEELKTEASIEDRSEAKEVIKKALTEAIRKRMPKEHFGIFFSGGVDSSVIALLCKKLGGDFTCYSVGFKTEDMDVPPDIEYADKVAKGLGVKLVKKVYSLDEAEAIIEEAVKILHRPDEIDSDYIVKIGVASVVIAAKRIASDIVFFSGLGSEEIFAGYERHLLAKDKEEECWRGLKKMWNRDLVRDCTVAEHLGISLLTPFLDKQLIIEAMKIDPALKIDDKDKKIILREAAQDLGLEESWRKKQGAQYGSRFDRAIKKLAKKNGFKYKKEYLKSLQ